MCRYIGCFGVYNHVFNVRPSLIVLYFLAIKNIKVISFKNLIKNEETFSIF